MRSIIHLHVPAFQVAVERARRTELRTRPIVVGPAYSTKGRVMALSLEAYEAGIRRGMMLSRAARCCRDVVIVDPDIELYSYISRKIEDRLSYFSPAVEPVRFGHFFVDVSGTRRLFGHAVDCAVRMKRAAVDELGLPGALGIAANKLVSSVAARVMGRAGQICDVPLGSESQFLRPLDVRLLPSVERVKGVLVDDLNVRLVGELASVKLEELAHLFGRQGTVLYREARGIDESPVRPPKRERSVLVEQTLPEETNDDRVLLAVLYGLTEQAGRALRRRRAVPARFTLYLRYADGFESARTGSFDVPANLDRALFEPVERVFFRACSRRQSVRHASLDFSGLMPADEQMELLLAGRAESREPESKAVELVRERYGTGAIARGRLL